MQPFDAIKPSQGWLRYRNPEELQLLGRTAGVSHNQLSLE